MVKALRKHWLLTTLIAAGALVLAAGVLGARVYHRHRLHALFEGPIEERRDDRRGFYPVTRYDRERFLAGKGRGDDVTTDGPSLLDKPEDDSEKWEGWVDRVHRDYDPDTITGATTMAHLQSPSGYRAPRVPRFLTVTYPPDGAVFPPNLCAPAFEWSDAHNNFWQISLRVPGEHADRTYLWATPRWQVPDEVWRTIRENATGGEWVLVQLRGIDRTGLWTKGREVVHRSVPVRFTVSDDPADNAVVYRSVAPPFHKKKTPDMYVRDLRERRPRLFLGARQEYCLNCHTFSSKSGNTGKLSLQVRYTGSGKQDYYKYLAVFDLDTQHGRKTILPFEMQMTTFMAWSPAGKKLVFSANQSIFPYYPIVFETQSIGQPTSDIAIYDTTDETVVLLPGAAEPKVIEIYPAWTPDGKSIVFSHALPGKHPLLTKFDLYEIPFNDGRGGIATPLRDGNGELIGWDQSNRHKDPVRQSSFYARFSPDGRWMSWVQADYGSLIKASSDVYFMHWQPKGGARRLKCNVPYAADSWNSWSSNSRWIAFATKREDGVYARVYMTHIDDAGNDAPAVRLPMTDPLLRRSFNLPEFVAEVPTVTEQRLFENVGVDAEVFKVKARREGP